ncbi:MAG: hypothetical protein GX937_12115 [Lentisphaerae bacterium]|jgi:ABC-type proline/glycine betaine transport system permease subunit|nr:hypothetical protein [Lentisphaerota bacterium]
MLRIIDFRLSVTIQRRSAVKTIRIGIRRIGAVVFPGWRGARVRLVLVSRVAAAAVMVMADDVMAAAGQAA